MAEFRPHIGELREKGIDVYVIGSGAPNFARGFKENMAFDAPIFSDEKLASYAALEMHRGWKTIFDPRVVTKAGALFKFRQRKTMGDPTQQGGAIVVLPDGRMPYKFLSRFPGDHPKPEAVVAAAVAAA